ncbi:hypothetical protein QBC33DRAFT_179519 [Phialemonium atrogriseum]|uniref:Secreted protein n=1 Tax=Phialemonium atrogriseum TaxID=1093897 RepID=A0AAJ0BXL5_9PEZI|nr:uncharacterized protein QBC33DRAFT_179519 [Phialemonium atrogriseum]KAK1764989.1 hypothetical protein QBC33DRAFT_179519 [Phialemonium atrogriseum]
MIILSAHPISLVILLGLVPVAGSEIVTLSSWVNPTAPSRIIAQPTHSSRPLQVVRARPAAAIAAATIPSSRLSARPHPQYPIADQARQGLRPVDVGVGAMRKTRSFSSPTPRPALR